MCVTEAITRSWEVPDAIGWKAGKWSALVECKASRADFRQDKEKISRINPTKQVGQVRYYLAPKGVIPIEEVPENWGLLELVGNSIKITKEATKKPFNNQVAANELLILTHLLRRAEIRGIKLNETWADWAKTKTKTKKVIKEEDYEID